MNIILSILLINILSILLSPLKKLTAIIQIITSSLFMIVTIYTYFLNEELFFIQTLYFSLFLWMTRFASYIYDQNHKNSTKTRSSNFLKLFVIWIIISLIAIIPFSIAILFIGTQNKWFYFLISSGIWFMSTVLSLLTNKKYSIAKSYQYGIELLTWAIIYFVLIWDVSPIAASAGIVPFVILIFLFSLFAVVNKLSSIKQRRYYKRTNKVKKIKK